MSTDIIIRKGTQADADTIADFQVKMAWETEEMQLDADTVNKGVQHILDHPVKGNYWIAEDNGKVVGAMLMLYEWSDWRNGEVLWIHSLYVIPEYRAQGVFKKMYNHLKEMVATSDNLRGIRLYVEKTNVKAQKVYEAIGMTREHYDLYEWLQ